MIGTSRRRLPAVGVGLLALAGTITSIRSDFTYDDRAVVFENASVHALSHLPRLWFETYWPKSYGGDGYRPFVMTLFTLEWAAGHGAPWLFHAVNIVLAVATALAVFWLVSQVLPPAGAWVAAALFAVHPVHVEATGNVVGQSELVVALCVVVAMALYLRQRQRTGDASDGAEGAASPALSTATGALTWRDVGVIGLLFTVGLFTKEHAIVLPALVVVAELTVIRDGRSWRDRVALVRPLMLVFILVALLYLSARGAVQRDLTGFVPFPVFRFLHMRPIDRIGTMMNEMPRIAQLLVFPVHLSADYSPADVVVAKGIELVELPGIFICLGSVLLAVLLRDRSPVASFGLGWIIVSYLPVSNLIVPAGFVTAERTLFLPSVGAMLLLGAAMEAVRERARPGRRRLAYAAVGLLVFAWTVRSMQRQRVWKDNDAFFVALMHDAPNGYRAHYLYARHVGLKSRLSQMELEYRRAIRIFPYDAAMTLSVADAYTRVGLCQPAVLLFEWSYGVEPEAGEARYQYVYCLSRLGRWADVRREALAGLRLVAPRDIEKMREAVKQANLHLKPTAKAA